MRCSIPLIEFYTSYLTNLWPYMTYIRVFKRASIADIGRLTGVAKISDTGQEWESNSARH